MGATAKHYCAVLFASVLAGGIALAQGTNTPSAQHPAAGAKQAGDADRGHKLFLSVGCYQCHGTVGQGGVGPRLAPDPLPADAIAQYIRNPADVMPPYIEKVLDNRDVSDIRAYLASIPPSPQLKEIPLLTQ